jgi:hypothetical protein
MRKIILGLAFLATVTVSCKEETKEKIEDANEAVVSDVKEEMDTAAVKVDNAVDTLQSKTGKALEKSAEKLDKAADKMKEAAKK